MMLNDGNTVQDNIQAGPVISGPIQAYAYAGFQASNNNNILSGQHEAYEWYINRPNLTLVGADATTQIAINLGKRIPQGSIRWNPQWQIDTADSNGLHRLVDPVQFDVTNIDTGDIVTSTLFNLDARVNGGAGMSWVDGLVSISGAAGSGSLSILMDDRFVTAPGSLNLAFSGGMVTTSEATGIFDGLLPSVGAEADFSFQAAGSDGIDIDYSFGPENVNGYNFDIGLGGEVGYQEQEVPGPLPILGIGVAFSFSRKLRRKIKSGRERDPEMHQTKKGNPMAAYGIKK